MKKLKVPIIICTAIFGLMISCRKLENPKIVAGATTRVPLPLFTDSTGTADQLLPISTNFSRSFTVDLYYKTDVKPKSMDIVIAKNGVQNNYDDTSVKILQAGITTFPTIVTVDSAEIVSLFGPLAHGDIYEISANITLQDGTLEPAFVTGTDSLPGGYSYGSDIPKLPGQNYFLTYKIPCVYNQLAFAGNNYSIVQDDWADYGPPNTKALPQALPSLILGPGTNQITIVAYPGLVAAGGPANRQPMIVDIDTTNGGAGNAVVQPQVIGDYPGDGTTGVIIQTDADSSKSYVDFCSGEVHLDLDFTFPNGPYAGVYTGNIFDATH